MYVCVCVYACILKKAEEHLRGICVCNNLFIHITYFRSVRISGPCCTATTRSIHTHIHTHIHTYIHRERVRIEALINSTNEKLESASKAASEHKAHAAALAREVYVISVCVYMYIYIYI
jgi:hypothetical protein